MRPVQLVRAAVALPVTGWYHAHFQGTRDSVGNKVPENMVAAEERLELLSEVTIGDAESRDWTEK
jgi:hypothetical protein